MAFSSKASTSMVPTSEPYPCKWNGSTNIRGAALVLNYEFLGRGDYERKGSEYDFERIIRILKDLGYDVTYHSNLSYEDTERALRSFKDDKIHWDEATDSTIVVIMSHGDAGTELSGTLFGTDDGKFMGSQYVVDLFDNRNALGLKGKPKLFFFNFCRGPLPESLSEDDKVEWLKHYGDAAYEYVRSEEARRYALPSSKGGRDCTDMLIVYPCVPRLSAPRWKTEGSGFIQALCDVLEDREQIAQKHIGLLTEQVDKKLEVRAKLSRQDTQTLEIKRLGFNKEFYLLSFHKLRGYYLDTLCNVKPLPWTTDFNWSVDEMYTPLVMANAGQSKETFPPEDLFKRLQDRFPHGGYRCLIEGNPGYGKSTLMLKMTSDWAKLRSCNYLGQFQLVLMIKLGEVGEQGDVEKRIWELYKSKIGLGPESELFESKSAEQVLVLFDGYDEASEKTKETVGRIMRKELWSQCHVVLTSRFEYVDYDLKSNALCAKLEGFKKRDVAVAVGKFFIKAGHLSKDEVVETILPLTLEEEEYSSAGDEEDFNSEDDETSEDELPADNKPYLITMDDFLPIQAKESPSSEQSQLTTDQLKDFIKMLLKEEPHKDLVKCPLLCLMFCCLIGESPENKLPDNMTDLYFAIINRNLYRAAFRKAPPGKFREKWKWDALQSKFHKDHENYLKEFGLQCLEYIKSKSPHFTLFELTGDSETSDPEDPKVIRLLEAGVIVKGASTPENTVYHPVHRTMAEFLAAYYLTEEKDVWRVEDNALDLFGRDTSFNEICEICSKLLSRKTGKKKWLEDPSLRTEQQVCSNKKLELEFEEDGLIVRTNDTHWYRISCDCDDEFSFNYANRAAASAFEDLAIILRRLFKLYKISITASGPTGTEKADSVAAPRGECAEALKSLIESGCGPGVVELRIKKDEKEQVDESEEEEGGDGDRGEESLLALLIAIRDPPEYSFLAFLFLTNLRLKGEAVDSFVATVLKSSVIYLSIKDGSLTFQTAQLKKYMNEYTVGNRFRLEFLQLDGTKLILRDPEAFDLDPASFPLEDLRVYRCQFTPELLKWLASSVCKLKSLDFRKVPDGCWKAATVALEKLSANNANSLEKLTLDVDRLSFCTEVEESCAECQTHFRSRKNDSGNENLLQSLQDIVPRFQQLRDVRIYGLRELREKPESRGSVQGSLIGLQKKVLELPCLKELGLPPYEKDFFHALADQANKWPSFVLTGGETENENGSLLLLDLMEHEAAQMGHVFRERDLDYQYNSDWLWFPPKQSLPEPTNEHVSLDHDSPHSAQSKKRKYSGDDSHNL